MALKIHKNGVTREMTPEEEAEYNAEQAAQAQREVDEAAARRVPEIKEAAEALILSIYPMWKQSNMHRDGGDHSAAWTWIDAVRAESNRLEADASLTVGDANWPTH